MTEDMPTKIEDIRLRYPMLWQEDFFEKIIDEIALGMIGERDSAEAIFLCSCGRLVRGNQVASYNLLVNDLSGAGKDFITRHVLGIWPKKYWLYRTRISPTALTYWKQHTKKEREMGIPPWDWDGKILYLEDVSNNVLNSEVFKVMCSSGSIATITKDQRAEDIQINGKPVMVITSASARPNTENIRRFAILNIDTSKDQTRRIMKMHAERAAKSKQDEPDPIISESLQYLDRLEVVVPFASKLVDYMPDEMIMRTHFRRILDLIRASTCLHQFQRGRNDEGALIAERQDYEITRKVLLKLTSNAKMVSLTRNQQRILDIFSEFGKEIQFSAMDLEPKVTFISDRQLRRELDKLAELGFLKKDKMPREGSRKDVMVYSLTELQTLKIPTWEELQNGVISDTMTIKTTLSSMSNDSEKKQQVTELTELPSKFRSQVEEEIV